MEAKHTPGPWLRQKFMIYGAGKPVASIYNRNEIGEPEANAHLIAAAPTMHGKLTDTVAWLDREIFLAGSLEWLDLQDRLTELRDDLAETLRKIEGV